MAKAKSDVTFLGGMATPALYKRNQGRLTRQVTAMGIGLIAVFGLYTLSQGPLSSYEPVVRVGVPTLLAVAIAWMLFRVVNYPRFADFLISVEAEMDKVTWASRRELHRSTVVVIGVMMFLGVVLFVYDMFWQWFFSFIGFLQLDPTAPGA